MPSTYAHYLFGEEVEKLLPEELSEIVAGNKQLFYIGLHGPDILFYYKPLKSNPVNSQGYAMHGRPASEFFVKAKTVCHSSENFNAAAAYAAGFICHYALDSECHGYIEKKIFVSGLAHTEIENEFDRFLIEEQGKTLKNTNLCAHIAATDNNAAVIAPFFNDVSEKQVKKALKSMKFYNRILIGNRAWKRLLVNFALHICGKYRTMKGCVIGKKTVKECEDSNLKLKKLFAEATGRCIELERDFWNFLQGATLGDGFSLTFGAGENWREIEL